MNPLIERAEAAKALNKDPLILFKDLDDQLQLSTRVYAPEEWKETDRAWATGLRDKLTQLGYEPELPETKQNFYGLSGQLKLFKREMGLKSSQDFRLEAERIVTEWEVKPDADFLRGHYPSFPLTPGVLICESVFQAAAILLSGEEASAMNGVPVLTRIENARFKHMVRPGETISNRVELVERVGPACYLRSRSLSGEKTVLRMDFTLAIVERPEGEA